MGLALGHCCPGASSQCLLCSCGGREQVAAPGRFERANSLWERALQVSCSARGQYSEVNASDTHALKRRRIKQISSPALISERVNARRKSFMRDGRVEGQALSWSVVIVVVSTSKPTNKHTHTHTNQYSICTNIECNGKSHCTPIEAIAQCLSTAHLKVILVLRQGAI